MRKDIAALGDVDRLRWLLVKAAKVSLADFHLQMYGLEQPAS